MNKIHLPQYLVLEPQQESRFVGWAHRQLAYSHNSVKLRELLQDGDGSWRSRFSFTTQKHTVADRLIAKDEVTGDKIDLTIEDDGHLACDLSHDGMPPPELMAVS